MGVSDINAKMLFVSYNLKENIKDVLLIITVFYFNYKSVLLSYDLSVIVH